MSVFAQWLPGGRLHLQHGPIDLVLSADGPRAGLAYDAARHRFDTVLSELVAELPILRTPLGPGSPRPAGAIARAMHRAARPFADRFVTPMASVAGSVADTVLAAMRAAADMPRAYVNNGGDIALHLAPGARYDTAICGHDGAEIGRIALTARDGVRGIATSGRHGRSLSLGIADSVTVLAGSAAAADVAATLIANAVDLPGHDAIHRAPAETRDPESDLAGRDVVTGCDPLAPKEIGRALARGLAEAGRMREAGLITGAALHLQGTTRCLSLPLPAARRSLAHA